MARPLRLQFAGALYHLISRGNARQNVFLDDRDRERFLCELSETAERLNWRILAYCLMNNHYHLFIETVEPSLARGMRDLNSWYAQGFNHRHKRVGHVFQGRYKAILVERPGYLLDLARYIVLNPVRAGLCAAATEWPWSSHRAMLGLSPPLPGLVVEFVLSQFADALVEARAGYAAFVAAAKSESAGEDCPQHPLVTGSEPFATHALDCVSCVTREVPRRQRASRSLAQYEQEASGRDEAIRRAHASGTYSLAEIGRHFGLHYSTVSRICRGQILN